MDPPLLPLSTIWAASASASVPTSHFRWPMVERRCVQVCVRSAGTHVSMRLSAR
jgi:hypothetical protein